MNLKFGRGPVVVIMCVLFLAAGACGASDGERLGEETLVTPSTAEPTEAVTTATPTTATSENPGTTGTTDDGGTRKGTNPATGTGKNAGTAAGATDASTGTTGTAPSSGACVDTGAREFNGTSSDKGTQTDASEDAMGSLSAGTAAGRDKLTGGCDTRAAGTPDAGTPDQGSANAGGTSSSGASVGDTNTTNGSGSTGASTSKGTTGSGDTDTRSGKDRSASVAGADGVATTTTTEGPRKIAASPWPQDPRLADDREWKVRIEARWPHATDAFTQGLEVHDGIIYESTGLYGLSRLRALDGATELRSVAIDDDLFGEGLTLVGNEIIQLTWLQGRALRWERETFEPLGEFRYQGEGWGICWDQVGSRLLMSDGTSTLTHRDRDDFSVVAKTTVTRDNEPVVRINELECVDGLVVANIWMSNEIIVIDPDSGMVLVSIDAATLAAEAGVSAAEFNDVLNGIAYNGDSQWILGGKNWPLQFLVRLTLN